MPALIPPVSKRSSLSEIICNEELLWEAWDGYSGHCLSREPQSVLSKFCPLANIRVAPSTDVLPRKKSALVQVNRAVLLSCCLLAGVCGEASQGPSA